MYTEASRTFLQEHGPTVTTPEIIITPEQQELLNSAVKFSEFLVSRWPQIDTHRRFTIDIDDKGTKVTLPELPESMKTEPTLNYYLSGSLATMLLSQANRFTELDAAQLPNLAETTTREIPESARKMLASFSRQIEDIDYVPSDEYKENPTPDRLKKGGGGPSFAETPDNARGILKDGENRSMVMCDPVQPYGPKQVVKITVEGQDYYIAKPDTILAYKVLHIVQSYSKKPEKFNDDFDKLFTALKEIYSEEELEASARQVLTDYEKRMEEVHIKLTKKDAYPTPYQKENWKLISHVLAHPQVSPAIRTMLEKLK